MLLAVVYRLLLLAVCSLVTSGLSFKKSWSDTDDIDSYFKAWQDDKTIAKSNSITQGGKGLSDEDNSLMTSYLLNDYPDPNRRKRASSIRAKITKSAIMGVKAVKRLIKGTTGVDSDTVIKQFNKRGSYNKAIKDFKAIHPKDTQTLAGPDGMKIVQGTVGDRLIILKHGDKELGNRASIEVKKIRELSGAESGRTTEQIFYF